MPLIFQPDIVEGKVYRSKRKNQGDDERQALNELQSILNAKNRRSCDCEAQLHDLLENCLNCGRLTCVAEGPGKCFSCGSVVLSQEQRDRLKNHVDILQPFAPNHANLNSSGPKVKIIDSQFDQFAIDNKRHLREEDKRKLKLSLEELQAKRYQRKLVLNVDIDNMEAGASLEPVIEDFASEMRKLQVSEPMEDSRNPTVVEALVNNTKAAKQQKPRGTKSPVTNSEQKKEQIADVRSNLESDIKLNNKKEISDFVGGKPTEGGRSDKSGNQRNRMPPKKSTSKNHKVNKS